MVSIRKKSLVADEPSRSRHTVVHHAGPGHLEVRHALWRALFACQPTSHAWICTPTTALAHPSGRSTAALLASRDLLPRPQVSSLMHYEGRAPRRRAGIVSASPAAVLLAARPRAGLILLSYFQPRAGALCLPALLEARSSILRWVLGGLLPPHGVRRCVGAT